HVADGDAERMLLDDHAGEAPVAGAGVEDARPARQALQGAADDPQLTPRDPAEARRGEGVVVVGAAQAREVLGEVEGVRRGCGRPGGHADTSRRATSRGSCAYARRTAASNGDRAARRATVARPPSA